MMQVSEPEEDDDDAWQNQQISKGAGRQTSTAPPSQAAHGGRSATDVFSAASGSAAASGATVSAGPERAAAAGASVLESLRAGMQQLQVEIVLWKDAPFQLPINGLSCCQFDSGTLHESKGHRAQTSGVSEGGVMSIGISRLSRVAHADALSLQTTALQASHVHIKKQLVRTAGQLVDSISSVSGLEAQLSAAKAKYTYMQDKRGYIADLCDMLQARLCCDLSHSGLSACAE